MRRMLPVAALIASLLVLGACGGSDTPADADPTATATPANDPSQPAPTQGSSAPTLAAPTGQLIDYGEDGVTLATPADVKDLRGAPADFTAFIARELAREQATTDETCTEKPQINVSVVHTGGWASGGTFIPQCGGGRALWARSGSTWQEVWGGQELVDCATLRRHDFPVEVAGDACLDGQEQVPYRG